MINILEKNEIELRTIKFDSYYETDISNLYEQATEKWKKESRKKETNLKDFINQKTKHFNRELDYCWGSYLLSKIFNKTNNKTPTECDINTITLRINPEDYEIKEDRIYIKPFNDLDRFKIKSKKNLGNLMSTLYVTISPNKLEHVGIQENIQPLQNTGYQNKDLRETFIKNGWSKKFQQQKFEFLSRNFNHGTCLKWTLLEEKIINECTTKIVEGKYNNIRNNMETLFNSEGLKFDYKFQQQKIQLYFGNRIKDNNKSIRLKYKLNPSLILEHYNQKLTKKDYYTNKLLEEKTELELPNIKEESKINNQLLQETIHNYKKEIDNWVQKTTNQYLTSSPT